MKTLIDIDEDVLKKAMKISGARTKKETVHKALEELVKVGLRRQLKGMAGSGAVDLSLGELKKLRRKREVLHKHLLANN
jgi:Arc/MetJ family transcription regulator